MVGLELRRAHLAAEIVSLPRTLEILQVLCGIVIGGRSGFLRMDSGDHAVVTGASRELSFNLSMTFDFWL
ncbi:hypothetical protein [Bradyrhizobium sp. Ai1a-2]|uniref:hypothetical protein n=1 Tax=Bradyrhizobium sp. Ai1a-2 TaxID=196490 RepID=UPI0003FAD8A5|nr:hypothetical protein [Bradyrhizobium sp. Ai1a-2]